MRSTNRLINVSPVTDNSASKETMNQCVLPAPQPAETIDIATDVAADITPPSFMG